VNVFYANQYTTLSILPNRNAKIIKTKPASVSFSHKSHFFKGDMQRFFTKLMKK